MPTTLTGKIFHFRPGQGYPNLYPPPEPKHRGKGRRSNRLYTLHPVVVVKEGWAPSRAEQNGARGNTDNLEHTGDRNYRGNDTSGIVTLPRRPSLNRTDGTSAQVLHRTTGTTVQIVNITSRIHPEVDPRNYLPIASPNRPLIQGAKRAFLVPDPGDLVEEAFLRNAIAYDRRSQMNDSTSDRSTDSSTAASPYSSRDSSRSSLTTLESPDDVFLAVTPDKAPSTLEPPATPEPHIQCHLQTKVDNHHDIAALPRDDSFIRLDSRGNVNVADLQPFISPNGHHYSLHGTTMDKIWAWIMEAELGFSTSQMEFILDNVHDAVKDDAKGAVDSIIEKEVHQNFTELRTKLHDLIPPETYTPEVEGLLENVKEKEILTQKVVRDKERAITNTGLKMMGAKVAVEPDENYEGTPLHEQGNCHDLMGGGPASLSAPVKSSTAMAQEGDVKKIDTSNPLVSPEEEAQRRLLQHTQRQQAVIEAANEKDLRPQPPKPHHVDHPGEEHSRHVRDTLGQDHFHHVFHQKLLKDAKRQDQLIRHTFHEKLIEDSRRQDHLIKVAFSTDLVPQHEKLHHEPHSGSHLKATRQAKRRGTLLGNEPAAKRLMEHKARQDHLRSMALSTDLVPQPEKPHHEAHAGPHLKALENQNGKMLAIEAVPENHLDEEGRQRNLHNSATSTELIPQPRKPHHEPHACSHLEPAMRKETTANGQRPAEQIKCQEELRILALHSDLAPRPDRPRHEPHSGSHRDAMSGKKYREPEVELLAILPYNIWNVGSSEPSENIIPWEARLVPKPSLGIWNSAVKVSEAIVTDWTWHSRLLSRREEDTQKPKPIVHGRGRADSVDSVDTVETLVDEEEVRSPTWDTRQSSMKEGHVGKVELIIRGHGCGNSVETLLDKAEIRNSTRDIRQPSMNKEHSGEVEQTPLTPPRRDRELTLVKKTEFCKPTWNTSLSSRKKDRTWNLELYPRGWERRDSKKAWACEAEARNSTRSKKLMHEEHTGKLKIAPYTSEHHATKRSLNQEEHTTKLKLVIPAIGYQDRLDSKPSSKQKEHLDRQKLRAFGRGLEISAGKLMVKPRRDSGVAGFDDHSSDAASVATTDTALVAAPGEPFDASSNLSSHNLVDGLPDNLAEDLSDDLSVKASAECMGGLYDDPVIRDLTQPTLATTDISCQPKTAITPDNVSGHRYEDEPVKSSATPHEDPSDLASLVEGHKVKVTPAKSNAASHAGQGVSTTTVPNLRFAVLQHKFEAIAPKSNAASHAPQYLSSTAVTPSHPKIVPSHYTFRAKKSGSLRRYLLDESTDCAKNSSGRRLSMPNFLGQPNRLSSATSKASSDETHGCLSYRGADAIHYASDGASYGKPEFQCIAQEIHDWDIASHYE